MQVEALTAAPITTAASNGHGRDDHTLLAALVLQVAGKLQTLVIAHIDCGDPTYASRELELIYQRASALEDLLSKQGIQVELQSTNALPDGTGGPQGTQRPPVLCPAGSWENSMLSPMHINNLVSTPVQPGYWQILQRVVRYLQPERYVQQVAAMFPASQLIGRVDKPMQHTWQLMPLCFCSSEDVLHCLLAVPPHASRLRHLSHRMEWCYIQSQAAH